LSRLVAPPGIKGLFCPGWCYQPGQKAPPRDSSKGSYSILSHIYYLGELAKKPWARQEVLGLNLAGRKKFFSVRDILSWFLPPGTEVSTQKPSSGSKIRIKASLEPGQKAESVVVSICKQLQTPYSIYIYIYNICKNSCLLYFKKK